MPLKKTQKYTKIEREKASKLELHFLIELLSLPLRFLSLLAISLTFLSFSWECFRDHEKTVECFFLPPGFQNYLFRHKVKDDFFNALPELEIPHSLVLSVSTCAPQWLVWSFCCCVVPVSCFVTPLFLYAIMQRKVIQGNFSRCFIPYLQEHGCVEIQKFCYHGNVTQRLNPLCRRSVEFNNHCLAILDTNALAAG